jgi:hypothetical protein
MLPSSFKNLKLVMLQGYHAVASVMFEHEFDTCGNVSQFQALNVLVL